jgi:polysaccharide export outer membrane protein
MTRALAAVFALLGALALAEEYQIGPGDVLRVAVLGQTDMTGEFTIDAWGGMSFPFLGKVEAGGMTAVELEKKLTVLLADGYLRQPHVSVVVKEFHSLRVFVTGEIGRPGAYGLRPERSLLALLRDVGELSASVGHEVLVIRPPRYAAQPEASNPAVDGKPPATEPRAPGQPETPGAEIFHVSLRDLRSGNPAKDFRLEPGDTVYFPRAAQVYVTGNVGRPGAFRFEEGLTVYQALNLAGGITEKGSSKSVKIVRIVGGQRKELKPKPTDLVEPEDTIVVPERFF